MPGGRREGERSAICAVTVPVLPGAAGAGLDSTRARLQRRAIHALGDAILAYSEERLKLDPVPLDGPRSEDELDRLAGQTITADGIGGVAAMQLFEEDLAPACLSTDHPRYLSFIPCAPTRGRGDVRPRRRRLVDLRRARGSRAPAPSTPRTRRCAGSPTSPACRPAPAASSSPAARSATCRPSSRPGTRPGPAPHGRPAGARPDRRRRHRRRRTRRSPRPATSWTPSWSACRSTTSWRLTGPDLREVLLEEHGPETFFAVVATSGTTNFGIVDDLASVAEVCREFGIWFHVDGAYGGAGLAAPSVRHLFAGIEHADSFIVDPHKWLFAPFDCCALLYREPAAGPRRAHPAGRLPRRAHRGRRVEPDRLLGRPDPPGPRPAVLVLPRRPRHRRLRRRRSSAPSRSPASPRTRSRRRDYLEAGARAATCRSWSSAGSAGRPQDYQAWSDRLLAEEFAFVVPTTHDGETLTRFAIVNPRDHRGGHHRHPRHHGLSAPCEPWGSWGSVWRLVSTACRPAVSARHAAPRASPGE